MLRLRLAYLSIQLQCPVYSQTKPRQLKETKEKGECAETERVQDSEDDIHSEGDIYRRLTHGKVVNHNGTDCAGLVQPVLPGEEEDDLPGSLAVRRLGLEVQVAEAGPPRYPPLEELLQLRPRRTLRVPLTRPVEDRAVKGKLPVTGTWRSHTFTPSGTPSTHTPSYAALFLPNN